MLYFFVISFYAIIRAFVQLRYVQFKLIFIILSLMIFYYSYNCYRFYIRMQLIDQTDFFIFDQILIKSFNLIVKLLIIVMMNRITPHPRMQNVPPTPNLEQLKKNKSKSRRKACNLPITNPPTPKPHKQNITTKHLNNYNSNKILMESLQRGVATQEWGNFNDKKHSHSNQIQGKKSYNKFAIIANNRGVGTFDNQRDEQLQKKKELDEFKKNLRYFGIKVQETEEKLSQFANNNELLFMKNKQYIQSSFSSLRILIDQKQHELMNSLLISQQSLTQCFFQNKQILQKTNESLSRYILDIDSNYDAILSDLSFDQFNQIIDQYNLKLKYHEENVRGMWFNSSINVYIPLKDIQRIVMKANVQAYTPVNFELACRKGKLRQDQKQNRAYQNYPINYFKSHDYHQTAALSQNRHSTDKQI